MNLSKAWIQRYGPLQVDLEFDDDVHLIHGPNESGKTLLVEAILKFLAGSSAVPDARIEEDPEGYVILDDGGEEQKLDSDQTLVEYYQEAYNYEITPAELRNIFVIRDADLRIDAEDTFYERVTDRITGIRTQDIRRVKDELRDEGRLTPANRKISAAEEYHDAGNQLDAARDLNAEVETYIEQNEELAALESQLLEARLRKRELQEQKETLAKAKDKREYETLVESAESIRAGLTELAEFPSESGFETLKQRLGQFSAGEREELEDRKDRNSDFTKWAIGGAVVSLALVVLFSAPIPAYVVPALGFLLAGYFAYGVRRASAALATIDTNRESLLSDAHSIGIAVDTVGALRSEVDRIDRERDALSGQITEEKGVLKNELAIQADDPGVVLERAEEKLEKIEQDLDLTVEREFREADLQAVTSELATSESAITEYENTLQDHRQSLREFSERAYQLNFREFTGEPLDLQITNLDALEKLVDRLDEFIGQIERDAEISRVAFDVFDRLEAAEEEKVTDLFGEGSRATALFRSITDDRYEQIRYDHEANQLVVERSNDQQLTPAALSKGTRDQLYLCIRVALAQELPDIDEGFFIMDDAFLSADPDRLDRQVALLDTLTAQGWQIIYLTAKPDAVDALRPHVDGAEISLDPLP
jgi:predicted  nucleic acid-binding Zn-ribbon protein